LKRLTQFTISIVFIALILRSVLIRFDLHQTLESVLQAPPGQLTLGLGLMMIAYLFRAARWQIWERSLSYWDSFRVIVIGFMGNNVLPARLGEILRAHCASAKTGDDRGRTTVLASIGAERILDGLILAVFGFVAIGLVPVEPRLQGALLMVSLVFVGLTSCLILGVRFHTRIRNVMADTNRKFPGKLTAFVQRKANQLLDGLLPLGTLPRMAGAISATVSIWGIEVFSCFLLGRAVWSQMSVGTAFLFLVVVNFASLVPLTMGGIGTIEAVAPIFLVSSGVPPHLALAMVILQHSGQFLFTTITGGILYLAGGFFRIPLATPKATAPISPPATASGPVIEEARSSLN